MDKSKDRARRDEREAVLEGFRIKYCVLCGAENLHNVGGKKGLYQCAECGGMMRVKNDEIMIVSLGDNYDGIVGG